MKVYLCYENYEDGAEYESKRDSYLVKIVDSEEKAKTWIFSQARLFLEKCIEQNEERLNGNLRFDEDGPYYDDSYVDEELRQIIIDDVTFYEQQLHYYTNMIPDQKKYEVIDINGYEEWSWTYRKMEVE